MRTGPRHYGRSSTKTRVAAGYDGLLALEPAGAAVGLVAVVGLWLHLRLEAGVLEVLFSEVRLGILRRWVLLGILIGHESSLASGGSRVRPRIVPRVPVQAVSTLIGAPLSWAFGQRLRRGSLGSLALGRYPRNLGLSSGLHRLTVHPLGEEPVEGSQEAVGALDVGHVAAVGNEGERTFPEADYRLLGLKAREHPVAFPPNHERRDLQRG